MIDRPGQHLLFITVPIALLSMLMAGCGEIAFKRGAGADALQADQAACRAEGGDMAACMNARGWTMFNPVSGILAADTSPESASPAPAAAEAQGAPVLLSATVHKDNRDSTPPPAPPKTAPKPYDPLAVYAVSSWWKRGGGRDDLESSARQCGEKLGAPHALVPRAGGGHTTTAAMVRCLRDYGWYGLGIPADH